MPSPFRSGSFLDRLAGGSSREERSMPFPDDSYYTATGRPPLFKPRESLQAYGDNVWLYSAVNLYADELARTKFRLQKPTAKGELQFVERHQALETMNRPQPIAGGKTMLTKMVMKKITGLHLMLTGEAFWLLDDRLGVGRAPTRIDLLLSEYVRTKKNKLGDLKEYVYELPDGRKSFPPEDVVHFRMPDPARWERGHAPTQAIRYPIDTHKEADVLNLNRMQNNAVPGGILNPAQNLSDGQIKTLRDQWNMLHRGAGNAGRMAVMPTNIEFKEVQQTNQEMQFVEGKHLNSEEILANYRVGPEMLGRTESQTRANAEAAIFVFMRFGILPFLELFADVLTNDYLPAFPGTDGLEFGFPDPVPENMEEKRANALALWQMGALPPDEARKDFGREPLGLPGMDTPYIPIGVNPVGEDPVAPNVPPDNALAA